MSPYEVYDLVFSLLSIGITSLLTVLIIIQTKKLTKKQQELDKALNESQREIQQRQLKLDLYNYRREIYRNIIKIYRFCELSNLFFTYCDYKKRKPDEIKKYYDRTEQLCYQNPTELSLILLESKYLLPEELSNIIFKIKVDFDELRGDMAAPQALCEIMTDEEKEKLLPLQIKEKMIDAQMRIKSILNTKEFIIDRMSSELDISKLEK